MPVRLRLTTRRLALLGVLLLLVLPAACRDRTPPLPSLAPAATVLAFGDSLTAGTGAEDFESYPARLQQLIGRSVVNAGRPGELSAEGVARLPALLDRYQPQLLLLCHGGNDLLQHRDEAQVAENLRAMVRLARERGVAVLLLGVPKPGLSLSPPAYYGEIAREFSLPYDGETLGEILSDRTLKSDPIHPNARGYERLAAAVADLLHKARAL
jgi:lysophospholipase L1-like esterase